MSKPWQTYALHILDTGCRIRRILERGNPAEDDILYDALLRNLQTMAEASQRLPDAVKQAHPDIPWRDIAGFRNILVHNYLGDIDPDAVMGVVRRQMPALEAVVRQILEREGME